MTPAIWNISGKGWTAESVRTVSAFVFLLSALLGFPVGMHAAEELSGPFLFVSSPRTPKDIEIEAKVRRALRQDAQLRPLNLGVHISGGIADLSGPVPTVELQRKALAIVQRVEGVLAVNAKDLYVSLSDQGGKRLSVLLQDDHPTQTRSASPGSPAGGTGQQVALLAPEMLAPAARGAEAARLTAHPHPPSPTAAISAAIEQMRRCEIRYQQIRTQVQGATVYVFPGGAASEEVMTFAQAVRRLPGVQHVIMVSDSR
jgi:osmotically-inducible protein OsmY